VFNPEVRDVAVLILGLGLQTPGRVDELFSVCEMHFAFAMVPTPAVLFKDIGVVNCDALCIVVILEELDGGLVCDRLELQVLFA